MAAGFDTLRDDRVHPVRFKPARFVYRRRRREDERSPLADAIEECLRWQPEVKAEDGRLEGRQDVRGVVIERGPCRAGLDGRRIDVELAIVRGQKLAPPSGGFGVEPPRV